MPPSIGKLLIILGLIIAGIGVVVLFAGKIPLIGKLPGDIHIKKDGTEIYIPIATSILISIILSLLLWIFGRSGG